jgi:iron complex outermembrane receptor protein
VLILLYFLKPILGTAFVFLLPMSSFATDKKDQTENLLDTVLVSADRQDTQLRDIAASISAVNNDDLATIQHIHINEALSRVPGTWISRGNGQENLTAIRSPVLTGAGSCGAFQFSLDGIPLRAAGLCNVNQLFEANSEQAKVIEVIRGPSSVMYGANAIHGSVNVITGNNLTSLFNQAKNNNRAMSISLDTGPNGYGRLKTSAAQVSKQHGLQINVNATQDHGYKDDSGFDQQKIDMIHQFQGQKLNVTSMLNASNLNQETAGYVQGPDAYKDSALKKVNNFPEAFRDARSFRLHSRIEWQNNNSNWSLTPYFRNTEMEFLMHFLPGQPLEENGQQSFGLQVSHRYFSGENFEILTGLDLEKSKGYLKQTQASALNGDSAFLNATLPIGKQYDFDVDVALVSPFTQLKYSIDEKNLILVGLRLERINYKYINNMQSGNTAEDGIACAFGGCRYSRPNNRSDSFENISSTIGWIHDLDENRQSFMNISHAFRAPQATELYRLQNNQLVADLKSEKVNNLEVGYRASYAQLDYTMAAYYMEKENVIFQNSDRENISDGQTSHTGLEISTRLQLSETLAFNLSASYGNHRYTKNVAPRGVSEIIDGNQIDTSPKLISSAQLGWTIDYQQYLELEWIHIGKYYTDEANQNEYPGHDLANLRYNLNINGNWDASARVTNLFDIDYAERADFGFGNERYFVGEPLSLYVTLGSKF